MLFGLPFVAVGQVSNQDLRTMLIARDLERESRLSRGSDVGPNVEGDPYLSATWNTGNLTLYAENKTYRVELLKYDLINNSIDVMLERSIRTLDGNLVAAFEYADSLTNLPHRFLNGKDFTYNGTPITGFLEVLCWGKVDVYQITKASVLRPNFNPAVGSGNMNFQIVKKKSLVYGPAQTLRELDKKELAQLWKEKEEAMKLFQKTNKLNPSKERDLMLMIDYFNTL